MTRTNGKPSNTRLSILPPLVRGPRLAGQRKHVLSELRKSRQAFLASLRVLGGPQIDITNTVDHEPCPETSFEFIPNYHVSDDLRKQGLNNVLFNRDYIAGCDCQSSCKNYGYPTCSCVSDKTWHFEDGEEQVLFAYDDRGLVLDRILEDTLPIYECTEKCGCDMQCPNKVVMRGRQLTLEVFKTQEKGWGVRSPDGIPKGTFISCYRGELLDPAGAERKGKDYDELGQTYLFDLDEWNVDLEEQNIPMLTIDACRKGDISRFFNHSCKPNIKSLPVTHGVPQEYEVAFFSTRNIRPREELCFDYDPKWSQKRDAAREESRTFEPLGQCHCGVKECRGWMFCR